MGTRVKARAVIWVGDRVVVHHATRRGELHVTLPGGRVKERESIAEALRREVLEEVGLDVEIVELLFAAEVMSGAELQDLELVFEAKLMSKVDPESLDLVDPEATAAAVRPPVLHELARRRRGEARPLWLGNIYARGSGAAAETVTE